MGFKEMNTTEVLKQWNRVSATIRKPTLDDACDLIESLYLEIDKQRKEVEYQKRRQDLKEQEYKTMIVEITNVVQRYK